MLLIKAHINIEFYIHSDINVPNIILVFCKLYSCTCIYCRTIPPETTEATVAMTTTQSTIATTNKPMTTIVPPTTTIFKTTINTFQSTTRLTPKVTTHSQVALQSTTYSSTEVILYSTVAKHIPDFNFSAANGTQILIM